MRGVRDERAVLCLPGLAASPGAGHIRARSYLVTITVHNVTIDGTNPPAEIAVWNAGRYEQVVRRVLVRVFTSPVGSALVPRLLASGRALRIVPNPVTERDANANPASWRDATLRGRERFFCGGPFAGLPGGEGTGRGTDSEIRFTPANFFDPSRRDGPLPMIPSRADAAPGSFADEMLCHEIVHSIRQMWGVQDCLPVGYAYDNFEEFCAVVVANMYASQFFGGRRTLRADHHGFRARDTLLWPFEGTHRRTRDEIEWLERMRSQQPGLCSGLRSLSAEQVPYNPFRDPPDPRAVPTARPW